MKRFIYSGSSAIKSNQSGLNDGWGESSTVYKYGP